LARNGNKLFSLPHPRYGKNPNIYNYYRSRKRTCYRKRNRSGTESRTLRIPSGKINTATVSCSKDPWETFVEHYNMVELVEEESLMRAFQRWRKDGKRGEVNK
jgi:hypothetical protein